MRKPISNRIAEEPCASAFFVGSPGSLDACVYCLTLLWSLASFLVTKKLQAVSFAFGS